jgi:hypothetical protein
MVDDRHIRRGTLRGARTFTVPTDAVPMVLRALDRAIPAAHFRARSVDTSTGAVRYYRRGSLAADVLFGGTGLSLVTRRIGPLSALGVVVVWAGEQDAGTTRVIVSLVRGHEVGAEFVSATDEAVGALQHLGLLLGDGGWSRAVDVDPGLPVHPSRAAELGLR